MNPSICTVARWEFFRFFKWRDQLIGIVSLLVSSVLGFGVVKFASSSKAVELAVVGSNQPL